MKISQISQISQIRRIGYLLVMGMFLLLLWNTSGSIAEAAAPKLKQEDIELTGTGTVYQLVILNKQAKSTYKWSSSNTKVAKVSKNGLITTVNKGTTRIRCRITYASGKVKNLYCDVTVMIPATNISINNAVERNGAHIMRVGESYNFNRSLTPKNSSDKTYWSLDTSNGSSNENAVRIDNSSNGKVTALRQGKVVLVATAAVSSTAKAAEDSYVKDAIIIEVIGDSAEVVSAKFTNYRTIRVEFGSPIKESTIINPNGTLSNNIIVTPLEDDASRITARAPGILRASLSANQKILTITANNSFHGSYGLTFTNKVLTTEGVAIYKDYMELYYSDGSSNMEQPEDTKETEPEGTEYDSTAPKLVSTILEDDGMTTTITFSERMDFSSFVVSGAKLVSSTGQAQADTISFLNNESNYSFSSDGKSIRINLSRISSEDYDKAFNVTISGLWDLAGNSTANSNETILLRTETAAKPQARPISVARTSYNTITATFNRAIKTPGYARAAHGGLHTGHINADNNRQVLYTLSDYEATLTGNQIVSIGYWDSYNVITNDFYANQMYDFQVYFTTENVRPILLSYQFNADLSILTLTYSENIHMTNRSGLLSYTMASYQNTNSLGHLNYKEAATVGNVVEIMLSNMTLYGDYTITIPEGFMMDDYRNQNYSSTITLYKGSGELGLLELAEPYSIYQSSANHSLIYIEFADQLDAITAENIDNYTISGVSIAEVKLIRNTVNGATIRLAIEKGIIQSSGARRMTVSGIKGYNGRTVEMKDYSKQIDLIENKDPELKSIKYDATTKNSIVLTFSEQIEGDMTVNVQERSTGYSLGSTVVVSGEMVTITLDRIPDDGTYLNIYVISNRITDLNGNESVLNPVLSAFANY